MSFIRLAALAGILALASCSHFGDSDLNRQSPCEGGLFPCSAECVDLSTHPLHCGECGKRCAEGETCSEGRCSPPCDEELELCGGECVHLLDDPANCGGCGTACSDTQTCVSGQCEETCWMARASSVVGSASIRRPTPDIAEAAEILVRTTSNARMAFVRVPMVERTATENASTSREAPTTVDPAIKAASTKTTAATASVIRELAS